jgi:hypothetical protein
MTRAAKIVCLVAGALLLRSACALSGAGRAASREADATITAEPIASAPATLPPRRLPPPPLVRDRDAVRSDILLFRNVGHGLDRSDTAACLDLSRPAQQGAVALKREALLLGDGEAAAAASHLILCVSCARQAMAACRRVDDALR